MAKGKKGDTRITIRIQDLEERKGLEDLTCEELIQKIGTADKVGAREGAGGNIRVYTNS